MKTLMAPAVVLLLAACSAGSGSSGGPTPAGSPLAQASGHLDAQAPMPPSFPHDVPIYPKARLTAAAGFPSSGPTSWGMEWETTDSVTKVQTWYSQNLNSGDWTVVFSSNASDKFAATFSRKSDKNVNGTLAASSSNGVTRIEMSLLSPPAS